MSSAAEFCASLFHALLSCGKTLNTEPSNECITVKVANVDRAKEFVPLKLNRNEARKRIYVRSAEQEARNKENMRKRPIFA